MDTLSQTDKLLARREFAEAEILLKQYIDQTPLNAEAYRQLSICQLEQFNLTEGLKSIRMAIGIEPGYGSHYTTLGCGLLGIGDIYGAESAFERALELAPLQPMALWNLALVKLQLGEWEDGWNLYEWGIGVGCRPFRTLLSKFDGTAKSVLIWSEQGLGDIVMFAGLLEMFHKHYPNTEVVLEVHGSLLTLFTNSFPWANVIIKPTDGHIPIAVDSQISIASLPKLLDIYSPMWLPEPRSYLTPSSELVTAIGGAFKGDKPRIGVFWQGSTVHHNDCNRSMPTEDVDKLVAYTGVDWITLQPDLPEGVSPPKTELRHITNSLIDAEHTAALIYNLDLVVTVDSFVAHLAGALGKQVLLMLPRVYEWRWLSLDKCVWYPFVKYIVQDEPQNWSNVIESVHSHLKEVYNV